MVIDENLFTPKVSQSTYIRYLHKGILFLLQIPVMDIRVQVALNVNLFEALESHFAIPHVMLTMVDVLKMNSAWQKYLVLHQTCLALLLLCA